MSKLALTKGPSPPEYDTAKPPTLSVVVPIYNACRLIRECLAWLHNSRYQDFELIVVDDGSDDDGGEIARALGAQVVRMPVRSGPASARNAGASVARGKYLVFLDADVRVHAEALGGLALTLETDPAADAVFGSYDTKPTAPNFISQYKNLFHHYVHQSSREQASTFWSGCGAVKRSVFFEVGGFDARFKRPSVEDIELGIRLRKTGHRVVLNKKVQVTHAKYWSLAGMIRSDVQDRAIPWTRLILRERSLPNDLNLTWTQRATAALTYALFAVLLAAAMRNPSLLSIPVLVLLLVQIVDYWSARQRIPTAMRWAMAAVILLAILAGGLLMAELAPVAIVLTAGIVSLNAGFYAFFVREKNALFAVAILPLHLLYFAYSGVGLILGALGHLFRHESQAVST